MKASLLYITLTLFFLSCGKNQNSIQFPLETQNGLNTFGCYIDGAAFIPSTKLFKNVHPINVYYNNDSTQYYRAGFLSIQGIDARYSLDFAGSIVIQKQNVFSAGE